MLQCGEKWVQPWGVHMLRAPSSEPCRLRYGMGMKRINHLLCHSVFIPATSQAFFFRQMWVLPLVGCLALRRDWRAWGASGVLAQVTLGQWFWEDSSSSSSCHKEGMMQKGEESLWEAVWDAVKEISFGNPYSSSVWPQLGYSVKSCLYNGQRAAGTRDHPFPPTCASCSAWGSAEGRG